MKMQPYARGEMMPVAPRGPLAERNGYYDWPGNHGPQPGPNGYPGNGYHQQVPFHPAGPGEPSYVQVLLRQIKKRWLHLFFWLVATTVVAAVVITKFAKPTFHAEGRLYYSPDFNYSHKRLYTPPNIQTILALAKSPEVVDKAAEEANLGVGGDALDKKLTIAIVKQSDLISVQFDWPNREQAEKVANRVLQLVIQQNDQLRRRLSEKAIIDLEESLEKVAKDELAMRNLLNETLGNMKIFDLKTEMGTVINEISSLNSQILALSIEETSLKTQIKDIDEKVAAKRRELDSGKSDPDQDRLEAGLMSEMRIIRSSQVEKQRAIELAKVKLSAALAKRKNWDPLFRAGHISKAEWNENEDAIKLYNIEIGGSAELMRMNQELKDKEQQILNIKKGFVSPEHQQLRSERLQKEVLLSSIPRKIKDLEESLAERMQHQRHLQSAQKKVQHIELAIDSLHQKRTSQSEQKHEHEKLEAKKVEELTIYAPATTGGAPPTTNHVKLGAVVFGLSILLFVGFIAVFDMPKMAMHGSPMPPPQAQYPVPAWQHYAPRQESEYAPPQPPPTRGPSMTNEHMRALAERIMENNRTRGSIVLFTPTSSGLRVENLLGDLGCFLKKETGRVLVFEARTAAEGPAYPAWIGPSGREVSDQLDAYLEGRHERGGNCFAETLIAGIDYARCDLSHHLTAVMSMYRFRRLMHDMKERYTVVLMITPERFHGDEDDLFTTLGEGIVVVVNEDADRAEVDSYMCDLRASETPVYGVVTVPPSPTA